MQDFSSENVTWNGDQPISMGIVGLSPWIDAFFGMLLDTVNIFCVFIPVWGWRDECTSDGVYFRRLEQTDSKEDNLITFTKWQ